jgi:hypothetical protein
MDMSLQIIEFRRRYHLVIKDAASMHKEWSEKNLAFDCRIDKKTLQRMKNGKATKKTIALVQKALDDLFGDGGKRSKDLFDAWPLGQPQAPGAEPATGGAALSSSSPPAIPVPVPAMSEGFSWVDGCLSNVSYLWLPKPVDIQSPGNPLKPVIVEGVVRLAPPKGPELDQIIERVIKVVRRKRPNSPQEKLKPEYYRQILSEQDLLVEREDDPPRTSDGRLEIYRRLRDSRTLAAARARTIKSALYARALSSKLGRGFNRNGRMVAVSDLRYEMQDSHPSIGVDLQETDYYSYTATACCARQIERMKMLRLHKPLGLVDYLSNFQEFVHLSLGTLVLVRTLRDQPNRLIIRKRSETAANWKDGGKLVASANEGLRPDEDVVDGKLKDFTDIVNKNLQNELLGWPAAGRTNELIKLIRHYYFTGAVLYLPNLSICLCFLVDIDCTVKEILDAARRAPHSLTEFKQTCEDPRFRYLTMGEFIKQGFVCPEFSDQGLKHLFEETIKDGSAEKTWDEGSLVAVLLSKNVP